MAKSHSLIKNIETGMYNLKPSNRNEVDSIKESLIPVEATVFETIAASHIDTKISNAMSVLLADSLDSADINLDTWNLNTKAKDSDDYLKPMNVTYSTNLMMAKTAVSYGRDGASRNDIKETLGGFIGGISKRLRGMNRNNNQDPYEAGF